ncbi:ATP-binding cassette sub-family A member 13 [Leptosomus discolor]
MRSCSKVWNAAGFLGGSGYLEARDLPSRGLYPFMRTLFCNVGSRCKNTSYTTWKTNHLRTLISLKDLAMMPLGQSFYEVVTTALNLTAASVQDPSLEGFQYNLSLGDVLWNPRAVKAELKSRFGYDDLHVEKLLSYTAQLTKIPMGETLEQFVCSALSSVREDEANKEKSEEGCISAWHEDKLYLVHAVSKLRLYAQVFEQWFSSSRPSQKLLLELERIIADLMSQFLDDRESRKFFSEINTLIQQWKEKSDAYLSEGYTESHDLILNLGRMQSVLQDAPQWPVMKRLLLVDGAIRNMLISNASYICNDVLTMLEKTLRLPQGSDDIDILAIYMCPGNGSEVNFKLNNQVQSLKESVLLLQKVTRERQSLPDLIKDDYLGWQEIEEQLTKNYAYYCEINQLVSTETPSEEDVPFGPCQEQLLLSLINNTLEEILFAFEENPYWKDLTTFVSWTCEVAQYMKEEAGSMGRQSDGLEPSLCFRQKLSLETVIGHRLAFLQNLPDYSSFISWARILTSFKEFLKREENLRISHEKEMDHLIHLVEVIEEIIMLDFSAASNQNNLANLSESLLNAAHDKLCNKTATVIVEATTAAMNLLKIMFEGGGDLYDWKDFETFLANLQSVFNNAVDVTSLLKGNSLEGGLETMGVMIMELQKSILKVVNGEFLNSWLDTFISGGSKGEDRGATVFSIGNSLSAVLKLSQKELGIILTEIKDTTAFFKSVPQDKYMVCISIFQNITKLILDNTVKDISHSQRNFSSHLTSFLNFYSTVDETKDCNRWIHELSNLSEKYKSPSHFESAKHILFLLKSLGNIERDAKLKNMMDFVNFISNLILPECSLTGSDVICVNAYFNIIAETLTFILPEFYVKDYISVLEFIFTFLNNTGGQTQIVVNDLVGHSQYTSNKTHFSQSVHAFNRTLSVFLNIFHPVQLSLVELLAEIPTFLKNKDFEILENSSSHLDAENEPFLQENNTGLLMEFFQYVISNLDSNLQGEHKTFLQKLIETAVLNIELVRKALKIFNSSSFTGFPLRDDREFLKHMVALVQNMRNMDVEFLISQFKEVQRSLDNFFENIKPLYIENSELGMLTDWWDALENSTCSWNLTGLWQITRLFEQDELCDVEDMFHLLLDAISLTERLAHGNITEALTEVYTFILTHEAKMPMFTEEELSSQVESLLILLETLTDMSEERADASVCFSAAFCGTFPTAIPQSDPTFKSCDFVRSNSSLSYNAVIEVIKELKLITLDSSSCTMEDFQMDITHNLTCFFHQIQEWNSILLKFSELRHVNVSVLKELLDFWNELSLYAVPLRVNNTDSINCSSTPKRQAALQIVETLSSVPVAEMEKVKGVLEQLDGLSGGLSWNRHSRTSLIKTVLTNVENMTSDVSGLLNTGAVLSFLSVIQPLMTLSSVGNQTYSMLMILSAFGNSNISGNFENFWFPIVTSIEDLLVNVNVRHLLAVIDQEFRLLRLATGQSSSMALDVLTQQFNTSSVDGMLRNLEDIQEIVNSFLCECNNKNYPKIMRALILLMANENLSNDLPLVVKDIIDFLELFQNKSNEDYTGMLFADGHFREKIDNTHTANSVLLNSLLHIIADLAGIEEALHTNNTELQLVDLIDSFFDNAQYEEVSIQFQNRALEIMQEILQMIFQSITEHDGSKITLLLKDLHKDIMSEMRMSENLELQLSEDPVAAFLSNFNLLNDVKVKECVQNVTQLRLDIGGSVNISEETINTILEASISHSKPLSDNPDDECGPIAALYFCDCILSTTVLASGMIKTPSETGRVLNMILDVVSSISSLLNKAHHAMANFPVFLQGIQNTGVLDISALEQFLQGGRFRNSAVGSLESVIKAVCKEDSSFFSHVNLFMDMPRIMGPLEDNMAKYSIPEDSTPFCLKLYQDILQSSNGALLWTFLKPVLHGKILYNSNINMIDLVMEKANFTFGFVENLKTYSETWLRMSEAFKTSGNVLTVSRLQEALQSNFIKHFIESNLDIDMEKLFEKMEIYETMMNKMLNSSASKQIDLLSQLVVNISSCVLLDRFQPFDSVEKLEEKAHELMQQNNFLASIIFDTPMNKTQDSSTLLPRHISYTIRTSVLYSMRTDLIKNPAWKSHPQKLPADGFKYNHIFIPLQDMIERAIISAQTGTDVSEPAIQVQAMPYPCHTSDLFLNNIGFFFPLMMMLTWMVSVAGMVRKLVYEREIHFEEYMKTMGVHPAIHFFAWFLENVIVLTISSCALAIILKASDQTPPSGKGPCTEGATIGVVLLSLTKEHVDGQKAAVKDLSLTFYRGQITALLGPNGAGKTTVISLLTGLYPPSSGTIIINGKDIRTDLAAIRTELGVCPQYDVLFDILTVREHLLLYGSVKAPGWTKEQLNQQVSGALEDVDLSQHQYKPVGALSGGMKRRLSIAISFIGNSKTVVLDEPTSGVDPCSRRSIWDVLLKNKTGCTLIFTTHHLDEAEVLSDRIAILQHGQLRCSGSPSYLRETYGQGHSLTLIKKPSVFEIQDPKHIFRVTSLVQTHIPEAFLKENSGTELTYAIPEGADKTSFKGLFQALDQSLHHLHVTGYGISDTTLEEVFLKLLQDSEKMPSVPRATCLDHTNGAESAYISLTGASSVHGARLVLAQIVALLMKRFHCTRRDWRASLSNVLLPVLFVALSMALFSVKPLAVDYPSLKLTSRLYENAESFFRKNNSCWQMESTSPQDSCRCVAEQGMCPRFNTSAPYVKNKKGHILYNLSGLLVEEYLVRSSSKARYGGWSFGVRKAFELQDKRSNNTKSKPLAKVWYNQKGFHSLPSYLNELNNLVLWLNLPPNVDWRQYGITLYSQPYGGALLDEDKITENVRQCGVALCIMLGFSILTASIGSAIVKDRVSGTKRLQHITGLGYKTYWLANFCCDMLFYMVPVILCVGVTSAFQLSAFTFRKNLAATVLLLILFGCHDPGIRIGSYRDLSQQQKNHTVHTCQGLIELSYNQIKFDLTSNFGIDSYVSPFEMNFLGWIFVEMVLQGTLLLLLRLFLHWDLLQKPRGECSINSMVSPSEDVDVEMERQRLFGGRTGNDVLLLYNLRKCYGGYSKNNIAVESINLGIPRGECFGLLGTNGAGKSTTFKMLTGDIIPSAGRAVIRTPTGSEKDILSASSEGILVGYCPQQDALDELLTGWEHLYYYCTMRGIPKQDISKNKHYLIWLILGFQMSKLQVAEDLVNRLHLNAHADKLVRTYSAGTKRKLSTAVALVGKPQILLLDEPSSGMDPCSKRYLWKTILKEVQDGCAAVLTSHSMEECEALCTRLAIMVNGSFKCLGSPQHIKNRFGAGYSVKVWLSKDICYQRMILDCLQLHFPGTQFKGQRLNLLEYRVPRSQGCLAELFRVLENHKDFLQIKHYSISQTTLEQVFINFATQQQGVSHSSQEAPVVHHDHLPV